MQIRLGRWVKIQIIWLAAAQSAGVVRILRAIEQAQNQPELDTVGGSGKLVQASDLQNQAAEYEPPAQLFGAWFLLQKGHLIVGVSVGNGNCLPFEVRFTCVNATLGIGKTNAISETSSHEPRRQTLFVMWWKIKSDIISMVHLKVLKRAWLPSGINLPLT